MDVQPSMEQVVLELLHKCTECGLCQRVCPFLEKYGLPKELILKKKEEIFYCTNCSACTLLCKEGLDPAAALYSLKITLLSEGAALGKTLQEKGQAFVKRIHSFPFSHWEKGKKVLWPGCSFWGTYPKLISHILKILNEKTKEKIGLVLDCCLDPLYQIGDLESVKRGWRELNNKFFHYGINEVIVGCTNCYKIFRKYSEGIEIKHLLEVLPKELFTNIPSQSFLHLPCPAFITPNFKETVLEKFKNNFSQVLSYPSCCGAGGGAYLDKNLSEAFLERTIRRAKNKSIVTFCFGCKNRFLDKEIKAMHLFETINGVIPITDKISSSLKWVNRLKFSLKLKFLKPKAFLFIIFLFLIFFSFYFQWKGLIREDYLVSTIKRLSGHPLSIPLYLLIYSIAPSFFISSLALTMVAGFLWGPILGGIIALTGATLGATVSFQLARYFLKDTIKARLGYEKWKYFDDLTKKHGWKAVAFARLFPLFPFPVINYLFGLTSIDLKTYVICTYLFMAPAGFAYTGLGYSLKNIFLHGEIKPLILVLAFSLGLTLLLKHLSKKWKI
ncbi:MAG: VTT domain-containing protein [Caldimicrobium sp.]